MDRKITLMRLVPVTSNTGATIKYYEPNPTWDVWAAIEKTNPVQEAQEGKQRVGKSTLTFRIRYRNDIDETYLIKFENNFYEIQGIEEIVRRRGLLITTVKRDNARTVNIFPTYNS